VGPSGSGKSTSIGNIPELNIQGLNPEETFVINVMGKALPFKGWKSKYVEGKNYFSTIDPKMVLAAFEKIKSNSAIKNIFLMITNTLWLMSL
jgi:aspartate/methionine/tyrosine aminotransferase